MALTWKQKAVIEYALKNGGMITKKEAMSIIDDHFYNGSKHVGDVLSRMVNQGYLMRIKNGVFKLGGHKSVNESVDPNQKSLF